MKTIGVFRIRLLVITLLALFGLFISACDTSGKAKPIIITDLTHKNNSKT